MCDLSEANLINFVRNTAGTMTVCGTSLASGSSTQNLIKTTCKWVDFMIWLITLETSSVSLRVWLPIDARFQDFHNQILSPYEWLKTIVIIVGNISKRHRIQSRMQQFEILQNIIFFWFLRAADARIYGRQAVHDIFPTPCQKIYGRIHLQLWLLQFSPPPKILAFLLSCLSWKQYQ